MAPGDAASLATSDSFFGLKQIFTYLFVTIGPLKVIGPFAQLTAGAEPPLRRKIALSAIAYATAGIIITGIVGQQTIRSWNISLSALTAAGGIILFLVAIRSVLDLYAAPAAPPASGKPPSTALAISPLAFPTIVTPYGIAIVILMLSIETTKTVSIIALLVVMMVLDVLAMLFARQLLRYLAVPLRLLANVLNVLQVALAIEMLVFAYKLAGQ